MRIIAIVRSVPDSRAPVRVRPDGSGIEEEGLKLECDPFDEIGLEQAIRFKSALDGVEVVVLAAGRAAAAEALRHGLAMGANRAIHVRVDDMLPHEEIRAARACAEAIRASVSPFDLILCGARTTDNGAGELGPALAEFLRLPQASAAARLELGADRLRATCRIEGGERTIDLPLPALVTCERGLAEPRHPSLPSLMKAKKQAIETIDGGAISGGDRPDATLVALSPPPGRRECRMLEGEPEAMARELVRLLREEAKVL